MIENVARLAGRTSRILLIYDQAVEASARVGARLLVADHGNVIQSVVGILLLEQASVALRLRGWWRYHFLFGFSCTIVLFFRLFRGSR